MHRIVGILSLLVLLAGPLLLWWFSRRRAATEPRATVPWDWSLVGHSLLLCTLAYNLTFFLQELFLVLPKAFTPGVSPILYHNNHTWTGANPLARLFQGTGALAIFLCGLACAAWLRRSRSGPAGRLFLLWMVYHGVLQALPQVIAGSLGQGDVGMAIAYLRWSEPVRMLAAFAALGGIVFTGCWLTAPLLRLAPAPTALATARDRTRFMANIATVPAMLSLPLIFLYRVPREAVEVLLPPVVVMVLGCSWLQANAGRVTTAKPEGAAGLGSPWPALVACATVLAFFQLVLRPGVKFF